MELKAIIRILLRRWWTIAIPTVVALAFAVVSFLNTPNATAFSATIRYTAATPPETSISYEDDQYYPWLASEYVVNAFADWVRTSTFAEEVSLALADEGVQIPAASVQGSISADNARSILLLSITRGTPEEVVAISEAATTVLVERSGAYFPQFGESGTQVVELDSAAPGPIPQSITTRVEPLVRAVLGFAAGIALAFLVEYLDPRLYDREQFESLGLPILAAIPRNKR